MHRHTDNAFLMDTLQFHIPKSLFVVTITSSISLPQIQAEPHFQSQPLRQPYLHHSHPQAPYQPQQHSPSDSAPTQ